MTDRPDAVAVHDGGGGGGGADEDEDGAVRMSLVGSDMFILT
jgi:hypothetical protein